MQLKRFKCRVVSERGAVFSSVIEAFSALSVLEMLLVMAPSAVGVSIINLGVCHG